MKKNRGVLRRVEALNAAANEEESRLGELERQARNIALGYLIWERCFLFAVSLTSSSHNCVPWWIVVGLSLSATALYLFIFLQAVTMMFRTHSTLNVILRERTLVLEPRNQEDCGGLERKVYISALACAMLAVTAFEVYAMLMNRDIGMGSWKSRFYGFGDTFLNLNNFCVHLV